MNTNQIVKKAIKNTLKWLKTNYQEPMFEIDFIEKFKNQLNSKVVADHETGRIYLIDVDEHECENIITWLQIQFLKHEEKSVILKKVLENYKFSYIINVRESIYWIIEEAPREIFKKYEKRINEVIKLLNIMKPGTIVA